ncbi:MAG TPA: protease modulator HflC [bacterium]|jgi:membrane protease subunit HflC|nr:protease modulator HflC [Dictyoglomota bacterium]HHV80948.1 protease modulator HflC [bacterium]HPO82296.1 protease modulator HflC [bacterium]HRR91874.1 protease modulator HflC [bacterium]HRU33325.1 protease modulator HflC [bacterium]
MRILSRIEFIVFIVLLALIIVRGLFLYQLDQTEQAVITRFGKIIRVDKTPGLGFKLPLIDIVNRFSKKILEYDSKSQVAVTKDKKTIIVDYYAKYRIESPDKFLQRVRTQQGANTILDDVVYSSMRKDVGKYTLSEIITSREEIPNLVIKDLKILLPEYGLDIVDVRFKTTNFPEEVQASVFERMKAERLQMAQKYISEGEKQKISIMADADKVKAELISKANMESQKIRGEGDRTAVSIIQDAYAKAPELAFMMKYMDTYRDIIKKDDTLVILSTESEIFKILQDME